MNWYLRQTPTRYGCIRKAEVLRKIGQLEGGNSYLMFKKLVLSARANKKLLIIIL